MQSDNLASVHKGKQMVLYWSSNFCKTTYIMILSPFKLLWV
uniref:Uncharacterized protein n=1 Tax=Anguilla anguilla TaxID=7936 RepID=A0A0E9W916_ANGAN